MYAVSVGFAMFGAAVCVCGLVAARRPRLGTNEMAHSRRFKTDRINTLLPVATLASVTLDAGSKADDDVDIHGVEAESDLKKSRVISPRSQKDTDAESDRDK